MKADFNVQKNNDQKKKPPAQEICVMPDLLKADFPKKTSAARLLLVY